MKAKRLILAAGSVLITALVPSSATATCWKCVSFAGGGGFCSQLGPTNPGEGNTACYNMEFGCTYTVPGNPPGVACSEGCDPRCGPDQQG